MTDTRTTPPDYNPEQSCTGCRYDSKQFLCLHPEWNTPEFTADDRVVDGRPWCYEVETEEGKE